MKTASSSPPTNRSRRRESVNRSDGRERMQETAALLKMLSLGNRQVEAGQVQPAAEVIAQLRKRLQAD